MEFEEFYLRVVVIRNIGNHFSKNIAITGVLRDEFYQNYLGILKLTVRVVKVLKN